MIDFGIARAAEATTTRSGLRLGTPSWMAPEQLRDRPAGPPSDVFAWGVLVAFAATGRHPFGGGPPEAVAYRILHHPPDLTGVPEPVRHLVADALARDPAARPTAALLASTLAAALPPTLPLPAADPTLVLPVAAGPTRRRRVGRLLAAVALLAGLVAAPQVVLAAAGGPDGPAGRPAAKHCPGDREDMDTREARDHEPDDEVEAEEEDEEEAAGTMAAAPDGPGDGDDAAPSPGGARGPGERPAGAGRDGPPPTGHAPRDPGPGPGQVVLGS